MHPFGGFLGVTYGIPKYEIWRNKKCLRKKTAVPFIDRNDNKYSAELSVHRNKFMNAGDDLKRLEYIKDYLNRSLAAYYVINNDPNGNMYDKTYTDKVDEYANDPELNEIIININAPADIKLPEENPPEIKNEVERLSNIIVKDPEDQIVNDVSAKENAEQVKPDNIIEGSKNEAPADNKTPYEKAIALLDKKRSDAQGRLNDLRNSGKQITNR